MKTTRRVRVLAEKAVHTTLPLPIPNQVISTTSNPSPSASDTGPGGLKTKVAKELDRRSAEFYLALCTLYEKLEVNPVIALHAIELFVQSMKRLERSRLGIPNPEEQT